MITSAGVVLFRRSAREIEVLLGHMGGPFWARRDQGAWTIPKGECEPGEDERTVALREFREETGYEVPVPVGQLVDLGTFSQSRRKSLRVWAAEGDLDPDTITSNTFQIEWPPGSGRQRAFPEIDRAAWFGLDAARTKVVAGQVAVIDRLRAMLEG